MNGSLKKLYDYGEQQASSVVGWYYRKKKAKATVSRSLRYATIMATAIGGLMPVLVATGLFGSGDTVHQLQLQQWGYLSVGLAALFLALDRYSGASTGWMRYIMTAMTVETAREQFRFDWTKLAAELNSNPPTSVQIAARIQRVTDFVNTLRSLVEKETQAWASEFQANLAQLDKDTQALMASARLQVEEMKKAAAKKEEAARSGSIDLSVDNVLETDDGYAIEVDGIAIKTGVTSKTCGIRNVAPGTREVVVTAMIGGAPVHASQLVDVKAETITKANVILSKTKSTASPRQ